MLIILQWCKNGQNLLEILNITTIKLIKNTKQNHIKASKKAVLMNIDKENE